MMSTSSQEPAERQDAFYTLHPNLLLGLYRALDAHAGRETQVTQRLTGFYEFGIYRGFSFWFANNMAHEKRLTLEFHGFDSFEGLPESKVDVHRNWFPGNYACSIEQVQSHFTKWGMPLPFYLHKGWYSKAFFRDVRTGYNLPPAAIAVVDCDLYESAVEVLAFLADIVRIGTIVLFDDYNAFGKDPAHGERRALAEFESKYPNFLKRHMFSFGPYGEAFEIVAI